MRAWLVFSAFAPPWRRRLAEVSGCHALGAPGSWGRALLGRSADSPLELPKGFDQEVPLRGASYNGHRRHQGDPGAAKGCGFSPATQDLSGACGSARKDTITAWAQGG
jgi:hypothetical protein